MNANTNRITRIAVIAAVGSLAILPACNAAPGRCVGAEHAPASEPGAKQLLNLDKDGVALSGYDPVAYFVAGKAMKGDAAIRVAHAGAVYYFATREHREIFETDPQRYVPQFGGWCAYAASINKLSPVDPERWEIVDDRLILQHNQKAWDLWHDDASGNLVKADHNWPGLVDKNGAPARTLLNVDRSGLAIAGYDPTAYFIDGKPMKGDPALARTYQGATYYFVDAEHKNAFEQDPAKFVPAFGGFCGYAASINKVSEVNPTLWQIIDGRLVLQHTDEAFRLFNKDAAGNLVKADRNWPGLVHRRCGN